MLFEFNTNIYDNKLDETFEIDEGFVKGNLFKDEYIGYKDYKPAKITVKNEREALLIKLMMLDFAINDVNLYLALNPDCKEKYEMFTKYSLMYQKCLEEYERKYQVLEVCHDTFGKYTYNSNPWPWEGENV